MRARSTGRPGRVIRLALVLVVAIGAAASPATAGVAVLPVIGQVAPANLGSCGNCNLFQRRNGAGPSYKVPGGTWTITSWATQGGGFARGRARLLVFRKTAPGQFKLIAKSALTRIPAQGVKNTSVSIDVRGGDRIGIFTESNLVAGFGVMTNGVADSFGCSLQVGQLVGTGTGCSLNKITHEQANVAATLTPR